jgi:uncharacterized cofD-like protein
MVLKWLYPGMKIKRWLILVLGGLLLAVLGGDLLMEGRLLGEITAPVHRLETMIFGGEHPRTCGSIVVLLGFSIMAAGLLKVFHSIAGALDPEKEDRAADIIYARHSLKRGPKIVVVGGGTGISVLLRGLKEYTSNLTAIVTVADDGGSSGRLRGELGILPPGDIRNCLAALADKEPLMEELLQYRFSTGELTGHSVGNLLLAALADMTGGFDQAVRSMNRVLAVRGQVLPATLTDVNLYAEMEDGTVVWGESNIPSAGGRIKRVNLHPSRCLPLPEALTAISEADAVVLGPGSLYTSIIPNLLVGGMPQVLAKTGAVKIYVCNVMTQPGETGEFSASDHLRAIIAHAGKFIDYAILNTGTVPPRLCARYRQEGAGPVAADFEAVENLGVKAIGEDLVHQNEVVRHNSRKLARAVLRLVYLSRKQYEKTRS